MPIQIPADLTIVTLRDSGRELPQRFTEAYARTLLQRASELLQARADIAFRAGACERVVEEMQAGTRSDVVDDAGYHFLSAAHRAGSGVRVLLVDRVSRPALWGGMESGGVEARPPLSDEKRPDHLVRPFSRWASINASAAPDPS